MRYTAICDVAHTPQASGEAVVVGNGIRRIKRLEIENYQGVAINPRFRLHRQGNRFRRRHSEQNTSVTTVRIQFQSHDDLFFESE